MISKALLVASVLAFGMNAFAQTPARGGPTKSLAEKSVEEFTEIARDMLDGSLNTLMSRGGERSDGQVFVDFGAVLSVSYLDMIPDPADNSKFLTRYRILLGSDLAHPRCVTRLTLESDWNTPRQLVHVTNVEPCKAPEKP